jgi:50S ribosomal protein L16 3-hydroxylase
MNELAVPGPSPAPVPVLTHLGRLPVRAFLQRYWQRRPLLIRQALPGFAVPVTPAQLFELSGREEVESRLIRHIDGHWQLRHGPLARRSIPSPKRPGWTLLVQGVDLHLPAAADLIARFRFVADARLDDLMVSFASDGGGVGPHVDSYDVFLLQALGKRRWRIERRPDPACVPGRPLRQLARFRPQAQWELEPGDLLYLPPGVAHEGVAIGQCITCSIGFRTPSWADLAGVWSELQSERGADRPPPRFRDAGVAPTAHPARLPARVVEQAQRQLLRRLPDHRDVALALLRQLSEPKPRVTFEPPRRPLTRTRFADVVRQRGLRTDRRTRMLYSSRTLAVNGELIAFRDPEQRRLMWSLADRRVLPAMWNSRRPRALDAATLEYLYGWYLAGWLHPHE